MYDDMDLSDQHSPPPAGHPGCHVTHDTALAFMLAKNLAGSPFDISDDEFIAWALARKVPDDEGLAFALREALVCMDYEGAYITVFDGRAPVDDIAWLVISVGAGEPRHWHTLLSWAAPDVQASLEHVVDEGETCYLAYAALERAARTRWTSGQPSASL